jgi:hypothetical protein
MQAIALVNLCRGILYIRKRILELSTLRHFGNGTSKYSRIIDSMTGWNLLLPPMWTSFRKSSWIIPSTTSSPKYTTYFSRMELNPFRNSKTPSKRHPRTGYGYPPYNPHHHQSIPYLLYKKTISLTIGIEVVKGNISTTYKWN